jgi:hypothetical protein
MDTDIHISLLNTGPVTSNFRQNAMQKLQENVDVEHSRFQEKYVANINGQGKKVPFNLEADAVASAVYEIIAAKKPKPRYYITTATYLLGNLKRMLSTSWLDKILMRLG